MTVLPLIRDTIPGIYQYCPSANTDYVLTIPEGAVGCILWFETSTTDATMIRGRIGVDQADTVVTGLTGADTVLGYQPPQAVEYSFAGRRGATGAWTRDAYVHVAVNTAGAVVRGMWLYQRDVV